jgi:hypothetical protein
MKEIKAFKCEFCGKVYQNERTCKAHEYKCYFNPRTRSCASCAFQKLDYGKIIKANTIFSFPSCQLNINVVKLGLQTKCSKYLDKKYSDDKDIMSEVIKNYDPKPIMKSYIEKSTIH